MATPRTRDPASAGLRERTAGRLAGGEAGRPAWALPRHPGDAVRLVAAVAVLAASTAVRRTAAVVPSVSGS